MKILLKNVSNTYNYGSMMMAENVITYLGKRIKEADYYIQASSDSDLERLRKATSNNNIYKDDKLTIDLLTKNIKYVRVIEKKLRRKKHVYNAAKFYDVVIILGGDDFSEVYYKFPKDNIEIKFIFEELKIFNKFSKVYMVGQTIGPYSGKRIEWAKEAFKDIDIYTRDEETTKYMKKTFNKKTKTSRDLAFLDLNLQEEYINNTNDILSKYELKKNKYVTVVGTGLISNFCKNEDEMIEAFYNLLVKLKDHKKKIVCLTHVFTPNGINDTILYNKINEKYDNYINKNCILIDTPMLPVEARIILGNGCYTITCRMHAAVSTFEMGKPAICLSYSKKFYGVIADSLKMKKLVIDVKKEGFWKNDLLKSVEKRIKYIESNKDLSKKIKKSVNDCKENVLEMINELSEDILK